MDETGNKAHVCRGCGHDLAGVAAIEHQVRCPECGLDWEDGEGGSRVRPWPGAVWIGFLMMVPAWWMHTLAILLVLSPFANPLAQWLGAWAFSILGCILFGGALLLWPYVVSDWIVQRHVHPSRRGRMGRWLTAMGIACSVAMFGAAYLTLALAARALL